MEVGGDNDLTSLSWLLTSNVMPKVTSTDNANSSTGALGSSLPSQVKVSPNPSISGSSNTKSKTSNSKKSSTHNSIQSSNSNKKKLLVSEKNLVLFEY